MHAETQLGGEAVDVALDGEDRIDPAHRLDSQRRAAQPSTTKPTVRTCRRMLRGMPALSPRWLSRGRPMAKEPSIGKIVASITHTKATRRNIPTAELQSLVATEDAEAGGDDDGEDNSKPRGEGAGGLGGDSGEAVHVVRFLFFKRRQGGGAREFLGAVGRKPWVRKPGAIGLARRRLM